MTLYYQTEYCLGRRGGRVRHSYCGYQALVAIAVSMALALALGIAGLVFKIIKFALKAAWCGAIALMTLVLGALAAPFLFARWVSRRLECRRHVVKSPRIAFDELA